MTDFSISNESLHRSAADVHNLQPETQNVLSLSGLLYDSCTDKNKWPLFLNGLAKMFGAFAARIVYLDTNRDITFSVVIGLIIFFFLLEKILVY